VDAKKFFAELKRRKVYRVAVAYAVVSWLIIQIATQTFPFLEIPNWTVRLVMALIVLGFPVALLLAWAFELTPEGIKRTDEADESTQTIGDSKPLHIPRPVFAPPEKSIAVLPFENFSDDIQNAYVADGIQDDILSNLAKVADLKVTSRTSVRQYKGGTRNLREIGAALGVAYVLEGSVRRESNRVRINAQLIDARTDQHIWNETYDREITDLFELQSELARRITFALRANLSPREKASLQVHATADMAAYELFLRARDHFRWAGSGDARENGESALALLEDAIERDPKFALAYCLASRVHGELYWFGYDRTRQRLTKAKLAADRALQLRPDLGDGRLALGYYYYYGYRDYELARTELEIAQQATPNDAEVWDCAGAIDRRQGRWDEAIPNFERARELDPRNTGVLWNLAETYGALGRFDDAEKTFADAIAIHPKDYLYVLGQAAIKLRSEGETESLRAVLQKIPNNFDPGGSVTVIRVQVSLIDRDYAEGARALAASRYERLNDSGVGGPAAIFDGCNLPKAWYEGILAYRRGDREVAERAFAAVQTFLEAELAQWRDDAKTIAVLGVLHAMRGLKDDAIRAGRRAVELLPTSKDAYDGPLVATKLAVIYAKTGEVDLALELLAGLVNVHNGPTPGTLRVEPEWDPLRSDSRFQQLSKPMTER
jgi:TolB-like protein/Tfp pilus assembly protein PilF